MTPAILARIAEELSLPVTVVAETSALFEEGSTIPFIARYRKEKTGGLDEVAITAIKERLDYFSELLERKGTVVDTITKAGLMTPELAARIEKCLDRLELEDLYLPFKPKRRTRAQVARELGLEPLALRIMEQADLEGTALDIAAVFGRAVGLDSPEEALKGALDIVAERICETPEIRRAVRDLTWREGLLEARVAKEREEGAPLSKFETYSNFCEPVKNIPSHRILAIFRGKKEKELSFRLTVDEHEVYLLLDSEVIKNPASIWARYLREAIRDAYERLLAPQIETEIRQSLKEKADEVAVQVFAENLRVLLMSPPFRGQPTIALDPGLRTGCKLAVLSETGKLLAHEVVYPLEPRNDEEGMGRVFDRLLAVHGVKAFAIGNGTGGKETMRAVKRYLKARGLIYPAVFVSESGASIYSASEIAREEFPDLDLTVRSAASIGRRLQDPLAELVKCDPKSIGVGQYQHDVDQKLLARKLDTVVESCVNAVGVDLNTASAPLLARISGLSERVAKNVVSYRDKHGAFSARAQLTAVSGFGDKTFELAAGFLRVVGDEPLDNSAVHPERYELVRRMAADLGVTLPELIGNAALVAKVDKAKYLDQEVGSFTINDILAELAKPNRDPRKEFELPEFSEEINAIEDLEVGMELNGVVTNVAQFGVFVDIGVHQDGMIHVSELDHRFIKDPGEVVKVGDKVKVKVIDVDRDRKRIGLSRKQLLAPPEPRPHHEFGGQAPQRRDDSPRREENQGRNERRERNPKPAPKPEAQPRDAIASGRMAELLKAALGKK